MDVWLGRLHAYKYFYSVTVLNICGNSLPVIEGAELSYSYCVCPSLALISGEHRGGGAADR